MIVYKLYMPDSNKFLFDVFEGELIEVAGGFTKYESVGFYKDKLGNNIQEKVYVYEVIDTNDGILSMIWRLLKGYAVQANQESVLLTEQKVDPYFLEQGKDY